MERAEIETVAKVMLTADGGCSTCYRKLLDQLKLAFPDHEAAIDAIEQRAGQISEVYRGHETEYFETYEGLPPRIWEIP